MAHPFRKESALFPQHPPASSAARATDRRRAMATAAVAKPAETTVLLRALRPSVRLEAPRSTGAEGAEGAEGDAAGVRKACAAGAAG